MKVTPRGEEACQTVYKETAKEWDGLCGALESESLGGKYFIFTIQALSSVNWDYPGTKFIGLLGLLKEVMK